MDHIIMLVPVPEAGPGIFGVFRDGDDLGDIEQLADGTWVGDVTDGNGPPSKPYATRHEAVAYVVNPAGTPDAAEPAKLEDALYFALAKQDASIVRLFNDGSHGDVDVPRLLNTMLAFLGSSSA